MTTQTHQNTAQAEINKQTDKHNINNLKRLEAILDGVNGTVTSINELCRELGLPDKTPEEFISPSLVASGRKIIAENRVKDLDTVISLFNVLQFTMLMYRARLYTDVVIKRNTLKETNV